MSPFQNRFEAIKGESAKKKIIEKMVKDKSEDERQALMSSVLTWKDNPFNESQLCKFMGLPNSVGDSNSSQVAPYVPGEEKGDLVFVDWKRNKLPTGTYENFLRLVRFMGVNVRYNVMARRTEISIPGLKSSVENNEDIALTTLISEANRYELPTTHIPEYLLKLGDENSYHPVANFVHSKGWDGVRRFDDLVDCIETPTPIIAKFALRKLFMGVLAGAFHPKGVAGGCVVPVFTGEQGAGKTTFFKRLLPIPDVFLEGHVLDPSNKDSVMESVGRAICELGELDATFRKSDIAKLKGFLSKDIDTFREPYARKDKSRPRRTVFVGTVNERDFFTDTTGNRRFIAIPVTNITTYDGDMQQVWAEMYEAAYLQGKTHHLSREEIRILDSHNREFQQRDVVHERLAVGMKWDSAVSNWVFCTATQIAEHCGIQDPKKSDINKVAAFVRRVHTQKQIAAAEGEKKHGLCGRMLLVPKYQ